MSSDKMADRRRAWCVLVVLILTACSNPVGEQFPHVEAIEMSETWEDWVIVGRFGPGGPFTLTDVKYCAVSEPCGFSRDGQSHSYEKFTGFKLAVLELRNAADQITHVVLRSADKVDEDV